ncbi:MAG: hypothetical protein KIS95_10020 [Anaerolineae bacterium]|uniref:hypothetical protein n=1 Tax=Promineifilum sp. TaxID=2664178 RepID=UPI001D7C88ED|nr:hypothetical protein [Anaerolineales bacterium]MCB8936374.1 hypothetical protein [Promineifilum sp.]MCO5181617.1 hypothetical protein [Promineifilum sp.]MCW5847556.1 hypothetical protein [Anaerolineae bacterium]
MTPLPIYTICVAGELAPSWADWFDGLAISPAGEDTTHLIGQLADQAALHGVLNKIRDLGLTLLSVSVTMAEDETQSHGTPPQTEESHD